MRYLVAELMFKAVNAWYEDVSVCILMSDKKEIRESNGLEESSRVIKDAFQAALCRFAIPKLGSLGAGIL